MKKNEVIQIRVTPEFKAELKERAGGLSLSAYILGELGETQQDDPSTRQIKESIRSAPPETKVEVVAGTAVPKKLTNLVKQLEAQGNPDAEEVARKRLGM